MTRPANPPLKPGRVYRTRELGRWSANPSRLAKRLAAQSRLEPLAHGLYHCPRHGHFGPMPADDRALVRSFLGEAAFLFTGPEVWNSLGLGATQVLAARLVYNRKRTGLFYLDGRPFRFRRKPYPRPAPLEWFVVDLLENRGLAALEPAETVRLLRRSLAHGTFDAVRLRAMAVRFGTRRTRATVEEALCEEST